MSAWVKVATRIRVYCHECQGMIAEARDYENTDTGDRVTKIACPSCGEIDALEW